HDKQWTSTPPPAIDVLTDAPRFDLLEDNTIPNLRLLHLANPAEYRQLGGSKTVEFLDYRISLDLATPSTSTSTDIHNGLSRAYILATSTLGSPYVLSVLRATFADPPPDILQSLTAALERGFAIYISDTTDKDIDLLLPRSPPTSWTAVDKRGIFVISFWMLHEMCHAIASSLFVAGAIKDHLTPTSIVPFNIIDYAKVEMLPSGFKKVLAGERGYYVEEKLGGLVRCVLGEGDTAGVEEVLLDREGINSHIVIPDDVVFDWVERAGPGMEVEKLQIAAEPILIPLQRRERMKGRAAAVNPDLADLKESRGPMKTRAI
ncbi:hypothetical protein BDK51DRAFT_46795, partial [Blyttiomyces helicus]